MDVEHANAARIYDYMLGGAHNFAVDRAYAAKILERFPDAASTSWANRSYLARAVRYCLRAGIEQFLDLGSGVPTVGNVHEITEQHRPGARVAYVDFEPVAVRHSREIVREFPNVSVTEADLRDPTTVLTAPGVRDLLDFSAPVAVLAVAALHFVAEQDDPVRVLDGYRAVLAPGSALVISHGSTDFDDPEVAANVRILVDGFANSSTPAHPRSRARLRELLAGFELVDPGLVDITRWRPAPDEAGRPLAGVYGAVGHPVP